jgi:hypothetical protein
MEAGLDQVTYPADQAWPPSDRSTRVLFENDAVRVWAVEAELGGRLMGNFLPYSIVPLAGGGDRDCICGWDDPAARLRSVARRFTGVELKAREAGMNTGENAV